MPRRFAEAIDRLAHRRAGGFHAASLAERGVTFATIHRDRHAFSRLLVRDLIAGRCPPTPGRMYLVEKEGKRRRLFDFPPTEAIIQEAVAGWLAGRLAPSTSAHLYSYRRGHSYHQALRAFARYVRRSHRADAASADRGLFVLRRDVHAYFDSIPVGDDAPLWTLLRGLLGETVSAPVSWALITRSLRPLLADRSGASYQLSTGIPTGSPVANVVANAYLGAMDHEICAVPDVFYARYGDDIVAAHTDRAAAADLSRVLDAHLVDRCLTFSDEKTRNVFLTTRGMASKPDDVMRGAESIELLGHRVTARGTIALSAKKTRVLLDDLRTRAGNGAAVGETAREARIAGAVRAVNRLLDPRSAAAHPYARLLHTTVTDRSYLQWLDYEAASIVLGQSLGVRNVRHFRSVPISRLRHQFGLVSLVAARNRGR